MVYSGPAESCPLESARATAYSPAPMTPEPTEPTDTRPVQRARVTMFFDGTQNNRHNTLMRERHDLLEGIETEGSSFENDVSNIARLETGLVSCGAPYDRHFSTYIEGIGTTNGAEDSMTLGVALGTGDTGVPAKVAAGLRWAVNQLKTMPTSKDFVLIHIDAYGFSRGAAAARHFIHKAMNDARSNVQSQLERAGYTVSGVSARFVGLFDTVASYGPIHFDDTSQLHLDAISVADQVIHIAAAEEHRDNFGLTNINSASSSSFQVFLPGVHSDIGGGYRTNVHEQLSLWEDNVSSLAIWHDGPARRTQERNWMIEQGWFTNAQLTDVTLSMGTSGTFYKLMGDRVVPSNQYPLIPLKMMADYSGEQYLTFTNLTPVPGSFLGRVDTALRAYALSKRRAHSAGTGESNPADWFHVVTPTGTQLQAGDLRQLRAGYFHMSAHYATAALVLHPNIPNFEGTTRTRVIRNG